MQTGLSGKKWGSKGSTLMTFGTDEVYLRQIGDYSSLSKKGSMKQKGYREGSM